MGKAKGMKNNLNGLKGKFKPFKTSKKSKDDDTEINKQTQPQPQQIHYMQPQQIHYMQPQQTMYNAQSQHPQTTRKEKKKPTLMEREKANLKNLGKHVYEHKEEALCEVVLGQEVTALAKLCGVNFDKKEDEKRFHFIGSKKKKGYQ